MRTEREILQSLRDVQDLKEEAIKTKNKSLVEKVEEMENSFHQELNEKRNSFFGDFFDDFW